VTPPRPASRERPRSGGRQAGERGGRRDREVRGTSGWLMLTGNHPAGVQVGDLELTASVDFTAPDAPVATGTGPAAAEIWTGASINVGEVYASLARDIANGSHETPGFEHALHNSRLVARVDEAARSGRRQQLTAPAA